MHNQQALEKKMYECCCCQQTPHSAGVNLLQGPELQGLDRIPR